MRSPIYRSSLPAREQLGLGLKRQIYVTLKVISRSADKMQVLKILNLIAF
jgi:hypothetical protein